MSLMHLDIELETGTVTATKSEFDLDVAVEMPGIEFGMPGPQGIPGPVGPEGPSGITKVLHGSDPNVPRPDATLVYWVGTVRPVYGDPDDLLLLKGA